MLSLSRLVLTSGHTAIVLAADRFQGAAAYIQA